MATYQILRADPAGNITLFVMDQVEKTKRPALSARLMGIPELAAEQVGFYCTPAQGGDGRMEMMGGEFCGNATRAFGMLIAKEMGKSGRVNIETSGCEAPVCVDVDLEKGTSRSQMPLPLFAREMSTSQGKGTLVHLGGIAHLVVKGVEPSLSFFAEVESVFEEFPDLDAYGVIFLDDQKGTMTPLVKVPAAGSLVWEGSCGSGSLAAAVSESEEINEGVFEKEYIQPAGTVRATVEKEGGQVVATYIGGPVSLGEIISVTL